MSCFEVMTHFIGFFKKDSKLKQQLTILYKQKYQHTIFYQVCQSCLRLIPHQSNRMSLEIEGQQQQQQPFERPTSRKSRSSLNHYENANLKIQQQQQKKFSSQYSPYSKSIIPSTIGIMSITQKQQLLKKLIQKSYLFIDLSDLFSGEDLQTYEHIVKQQVFEGQQSIVQSILQSANKKGIKDRLKYFDTEALYLLKGYVDFCDHIIKKLRPSSQQQERLKKNQFFTRLLLQLKAKLQYQFPDELVANSHLEILNLVKQYRVMNDIILSTLEKVQKIKILPQDSHEYEQNFYTYPNISTLVSVILFMDENFLKAIYSRFIEGLKLCASRLGQRLIMKEQKFFDQLKSSYFGIKIQTLSKNKSSSKIPTSTLVAYKSNLQQMLQGNSSSSNQIFPYFKKSLRTLQTLATHHQPIKCLKIVYQLNKTIQKEHTQFINDIIRRQAQAEQQNERFFLENANRRSQAQQMRTSQKKKKFSYSRQTECFIIEYLLMKKRQKLRFIIPNIMIAYYFVHENMLKDKKGSCLMPFVEIIQNLGIN